MPPSGVKMRVCACRSIAVCLFAVLVLPCVESGTPPEPPTKVDCTRWCCDRTSCSCGEKGRPTRWTDMRWACRRVVEDRRWDFMPYPGVVFSPILRHMAQTPEPRVEPGIVAGQLPYSDGICGRLRRPAQHLTRAGIIAGVVLVVAVIFVSGFFWVWSGDNHYRGQRVSTGDHSGFCPMAGPGGMLAGSTPGRQCPR